MADSTSEVEVGEARIAQDGDDVIVDVKGLEVAGQDMGIYTGPDSNKDTSTAEGGKAGNTSGDEEGPAEEAAEKPPEEEGGEEKALEEPSTSHAEVEDTPKKKKKARAKKSSLADQGDNNEVRRSARERHTKKYEDFLDDDDLDEEGDGLTAAQRDELNKRIKKIGSIKTWGKKCSKLVGETAKMNHTYVSKITYPPAPKIVQEPCRPSQSLKKYYLPEIEIEPLKESSHCQFLYRPQDTFGVDMASGGSCDYACTSCEFTTTRVTNMIRHQVIDCVFNKDFFSWNENCLSEATAKRKKVKRPHEEQEEKFKGEELPEEVTASQESSVSQVPKKLRADAANLSSSEDESDGDDLADEIGFRKHDVVWVEHENDLHWPALVLKIKKHGPKKARKTAVRLRVYLIHNGEKETHPITKVDGFDSSQRQSYLEGGKKTSQAEEHARAAQKADKFLREKVLGVNIDPIRFFCLGETKLIEERETSSSEDDEKDEEEGTSTPTWHLIEPEALPEDDGSSGAQSVDLAKKAKRRRRAENDSLVEFITGGKVEPHLVGIFRGTVPSERHDQFTSNDESLRTRLKQSSWWGPVDDQQQQETIYEYCHELVLRSCESTDDTFDTIKYAFEVFCPEAITKAISKLSIVDLEEAAKIFNRGSETAKQLVDLQKIGGTRTTDEEYTNEEEMPTENLDTSAVVKEELERLGVDSSLLSEIDKD